MSGNLLEAIENSERSYEAEPSIEKSAPVGYPSLNPVALPRNVGSFVRLATDNSEADPAAVLFTLLSALGCAFGSKRYFEVGDQRHPPRHFSAIVGVTGAGRKGTSAAPIERLLSQMNGYSPIIAHGPFSSGEGVISAVRDDVLDANGEVSEIGVKDKRLFILEGELANLFIKQKTQGNSLSTIIRTAWDITTGQLRPLIKNNKETATAPHVSVVGHITPEELQSLLTTTDVNNGLLNRFGLVCSRRTKLVPHPVAIPADQLSSFATLFSAAVQFADEQPGPVSFDSEARDRWTEFYTKHNESPMGGVLGKVTNRTEPQIIRYALTYSIIEQSAKVTLDHLNSAIAAWEYCIDSARYIFNASNSVDDLGAQILSLLADDNRSQSELVNMLKSKGYKAKDLTGKLREMMDRGTIDQRNVRNGGRPAKIYQLKQAS